MIPKSHAYVLIGKQGEVFGSGSKAAMRRLRSNRRAGPFADPGEVRLNLSPEVHPERGDYVALAGADGLPTENHTPVWDWVGKSTDYPEVPGFGWTHRIIDNTGEVYRVVRAPEYDTPARHGWKEVL